MAPRKKTRSKSNAKSAKKVRSRATKAKTSQKLGTKLLTRKRVALKPKVRRGKKAGSVNAEKELKREFQNQGLTEGSRSPARRSQDFEGASRAEQADSESVDELIEEGNLFEAGAVAGVQRADDADEKEVRTRELPEDDVPEEYDKD